MNSIQNLFNNKDSDFIIPRIDNRPILSEFEVREGINFQCDINSINENSVIARCFCNIEDNLIKLQIRNFYKFIKSHTILDKIFGLSIQDKITIARLDCTTRQLCVTADLDPLKLRATLITILNENLIYVKELELENYLIYNRELLEEDDDDDDDENEEEEENNGEEEEEDNEPKEPPVKIQLAITINGKQLNRIDENQKKTIIEKLNEEEEQIKLKRKILEKIIFSLTDDDIMQMDILQNKENEQAKQDDDEDDDN